MARIGFVIASVFALATVLACQRDDSSINDKLDELAENQKKILEKVGQGGGSGSAAAERARKARAKKRRRAKPKPNEIYAVPIEGAPAVGPKHAKVTMVEAFEFA